MADSERGECDPFVDEGLSQERGALFSRGRALAWFSALGLATLSCVVVRLSFGYVAPTRRAPVHRNALISMFEVVDTPSTVLAGGGLEPAGVLETKESSRNLQTYDAIAKEVTKLADQLDRTCTDMSNECPKGEFAACILRLAGHDFMDRRPGMGGSDGCVDFSDEDNDGLMPCLSTGAQNQHSGEPVKLKDAYAKFKDDVSLADFIVIAAEAVMVDLRGNLQPPLDFRTRFQWGRVTRVQCNDNPELPKPDEEGCDANENIFIHNLGLTWRQTAALMGVHSLGRARLENSGFDGWWSDPISSTIFNNNYYLSILLKGWAPEENDARPGKPAKKQWKRIGDDQLRNKQMMLNTDLCLAFGEFADHAESDDCCAWAMNTIYPDKGMNAATILQEQTKAWFPDQRRHWCGFGVLADPSFFTENPNEDNVREWCCADAHGQFAFRPFEQGDPRYVEGPRDENGKIKDCGDPKILKGKAANDVIEFSVDETAWIKEFHVAWALATSVKVGTAGWPWAEGLCLIGDSFVKSRHVGEISVASLSQEDQVLTSSTEGGAYEQVLGFLHLEPMQATRFWSSNTVGLQTNS